MVDDRVVRKTPGTGTPTVVLIGTSRALVAVLVAAALWPVATWAEPGRVFTTEIACAKAAGFDATACRRLFAAARAEFEAKTHSYPSRFACYRAYGPCMPWPIGAAGPAHFRPQWMGVIVSGPAEARTSLPAVAPGRLKLAFAPHGPADMALAVRDPRSEGFAVGAAPGPLCRQIAAVAVKAHLPPAFLARLLWQESSFRTDVVSRAGALGIAQFMPGTAEERGLEDPFDPTKAIESSAGLLGDLAKRFGNLGLAAAAYNGGPARVSGWLKGQRSLAAETQDYVQRITGRPVEAWVARADDAAALSSLPAPCRFPVPPDAAALR